MRKTKGDTLQEERHVAELQRVKGRLKKKYRDACKKKKSGIFKFVALELLSFHH